MSSGILLVSYNGTIMIWCVSFCVKPDENIHKSNTIIRNTNNYSNYNVNNKQRKLQNIVNSLEIIINMFVLC